MIYFFLGIGITVFLFLVFGMYLRIIEEIKRIQTGVVYLVKREYEFEQSEIEIQKEMNRKQEAMNRVGIN